jgi:hypothetical protein
MPQYPPSAMPLPPPPPLTFATTVPTISPPGSPLPKPPPPLSLAPGWTPGVLTKSVTPPAKFPPLPPRPVIPAGMTGSPTPPSTPKASSNSSFVTIHASQQIVDSDAHPIYEPERWNKEPVLTSTNCYVYACNDPDGHPPGFKPQPGQLGDSCPLHMNASLVRYAVLQDGKIQGDKNRLVPFICEDNQLDFVPNIAGHYLVALVMAPGHDYHWYRQDRNGMWSHKPGHTTATNLDASGKPIRDPRFCDMDYSKTKGPHYQFVMYFHCPKGGVRTGSMTKI